MDALCAHRPRHRHRSRCPNGLIGSLPNLVDPTVLVESPTLIKAPTRVCPLVRVQKALEPHLKHAELTARQCLEPRLLLSRGGDVYVEEIFVLGDEIGGADAE